MNIRSEETSSQSIITEIISFFIAFFKYLYLRVRQIFFYTWAFSIWLTSFVGNVKNSVVRKMFWGRSSFYRSAFQVGVGFMTMIIGIGGIAGRLNIFSTEVDEVLAFPDEQVGDADYMDEGASMQAIVSGSSLSRGYDVEIYIVQQGDTIGTIAEKYGVSADTIRWANDITGDYLKIGQKLEILPINGVMYKVESGDSLAGIADKFNASEQDIFDINWLDSKNLKEGQELLVPNGRKPQPKPQVVAQPTPQPQPQPPVYTGSGGTGNFIRPCNCGYISNYFSAWHGGVDIAQGGGCQTLAADSGTVIMARWYGAGGLQIMIDHGNGFVTLYAHNSAIYVSEGQQVTRGQPIGYMGSTGRSTGTHLHFGVSRNDIWVNPLAYVSI